MNNKMIVGIVLSGFLGCAGTIFGMENQKKLYSLTVGQEYIVLKTCEKNRNYKANNFQEHYTNRQEITKAHKIDYAQLAKLLDENEVFNLTFKEKTAFEIIRKEFKINEVVVKSWPILWSDIRKGNFQSSSRCITMTPCSYSLEEKDIIEYVKAVKLDGDAVQIKGSSMVKPFFGVAFFSVIAFMVWRYCKRA